MQVYGKCISFVDSHLLCQFSSSIVNVFCSVLNCNIENQMLEISIFVSLFITISEASRESYVAFNSQMNSWRCLVCQKEFVRRSKVYRHLEMVHFDNPRLQCHICLKTFKNRFSLDGHVKKVHMKGLIQRRDLQLDLSLCL